MWRLCIQKNKKIDLKIIWILSKLFLERSFYGIFIEWILINSFAHADNKFVKTNNYHQYRFFVNLLD